MDPEASFDLPRAPIELAEVVLHLSHILLEIGDGRHNQLRVCLSHHHLLIRGSADGPGIQDAIRIELLEDALV